MLLNKITVFRIIIDNESSSRFYLKRSGNIVKDLDIECQLLLEEYMACGVGACMGCVVKVRTDDRKDFEYKRVCKEGPVFNANNIMLE